MAFETITMAVLTHPVHVLLASAILVEAGRSLFAKLAVPRLSLPEELPVR